MPFKPKERQYRALVGIKDMAADDDELILRGCPIVFDTPTVLWTDDDGKEYYEKIDRHALDQCDFSDFIFNRNHGGNDGTVFARSKNGSLLHTIAERGLETEIHLDKTDQRHIWLYNDIKAGRIDKMSFCFNWDYGYTYDTVTRTRTITKVDKLYDVSAVDFPAYDAATISTARSFFCEERAKEIKELEQAVRRKRLLLKTYF
nr:MAG TPA: prohead serine protease [Caudoviricetes sp.]